MSQSPEFDEADRFSEEPTEAALVSMSDGAKVPAAEVGRYMGEASPNDEPYEKKDFVIGSVLGLLAAGMAVGGYKAYRHHRQDDGRDN